MEIEISQLTLFLSLVQQQNQLSLSEFSKKKLERKYGKEEAAKRIYATTDAKKGALKGLATAEGYEAS